MQITKVIADVFGRTVTLKPRSWKEPHLLLYQRVEGKPIHTGVDMHYDGCDMTFQIMLSDINDYTGGGTFFRCMKKTLKLQQGQVLVHPGELYHKGVDITSGVRFLVVGFMDGFNPQIYDESNENDCNQEDEKDIIMC